MSETNTTLNINYTSIKKKICKGDAESQAPVRTWLSQPRESHVLGEYLTLISGEHSSGNIKTDS